MTATANDATPAPIPKARKGYAIIPATVHGTAEDFALELTHGKLPAHKAGRIMSNGQPLTTVNAAKWHHAETTWFTYFSPDGIEVYLGDKAHSPGIVCAVLHDDADGRRQQQYVTRYTLFGYDFDSGHMTVDDAVSVLADAGHCAALYTTASHRATSSTIPRKFFNEDFSDENVRTILAEKKGYAPHIAKGARLIDNEIDTPKGYDCLIDHPPVDKFRVLFPLEEPFVVHRPDADKTALITEFKDAQAGAGVALFGKTFDLAATDGARVFFLPSAKTAEAAQGVEYHLFGSSRIRIDAYPQVSAKSLRGGGSCCGRGTMTAFEAFAGAERVYTKSGHDLTKWVARFGGRFMVRDALHNAGTDFGSNDRILCPFVNDHGSQDYRHDVTVTDPDRSRGFSLRCFHASCAAAGRDDRLEMLRAFVDEEADDGSHLPLEWLTDEMFVGDYEDGDEDWILDWHEDAADKRAEGGKVSDPDTDGDEGDDEDDEFTPSRTYTSVKRAIKSALYRVGEMEEGDRVAVQQLITDLAHSKVSLDKAGIVFGEIKKALKIPIKTCVAMYELVADEIPPDEDDDVPADVIEGMNERFAVVMYKNRCRVMEIPTKPGVPVTMVPEYDFKAFHANECVMLNDKPVPLPVVWWNHPDRKAYANVVFAPGEEVPDDTFNLFTGWAMEAAQGECPTILAHIRDNICGGDEKKFAWLLTWFAQIRNEPGRKPGTAVAVTGKKGAGKSCLFEAFADSLGPAFGCVVSSEDHITGKFNGFTETAILMVCEEAINAGSRKAKGVMKDRITGRKGMVERKGFDATYERSFTRYVFLTNEGHVVDASLGDERRYAVYECGDGAIGDKAFFDRLYGELRGDGFKAFLWMLENGEWDYSILTFPPLDAALRRQAEHGLEPGEAYFLDAIREGEFPDEGDDGDSLSTVLSAWASDKPCTVTESDLYRSWFAYQKAMQVRFAGKLSKAHFRACSEKWLGVRAKRPRDGDGKRLKARIKLPALDEVREHIADRFGIDIET